MKKAVIFVVFCIVQSLAASCSACNNTLWIFSGNNQVSTYDLQTNTQTVLTNPTLQGGATDLAWTADEQLFLLQTDVVDNIPIIRLIEIVPHFQNATFSIETQVTFNNEFANALGGNCDGTLWTLSNLFGFATTQNISTLTFVQIDPVTNTILQRIPTSIFTSGDVSFTFMDDMFYVTGVNVSASPILGEELFSFNINTMELENIGPLPGSTFGTANCDGVLYTIRGNGELYRVIFEPFSLEFIDNTLPNVAGMSAQLMRFPTTTTTTTTTTTAAVIELSNLSQRTTWTIILVTLLVPLLLTCSCVFMWWCFCHRKKCTTFNPTEKQSYDSVQQLANGRIIKKNYYGQFLLAASNVVKVDRTGIVHGRFDQDKENAVFSCNVPLYVGNALGENVFPGNNRILLNGFLPIPRNENLYMYVHDGHAFRRKRF